MNYSELKLLAKATKTPVKSLIALAPCNDPFYTGAPAQLAAGEWFAEQYRGGEFGRGVHLRRIHYFLISQEEPVLMRNAKAYENTVECWKELCSASKAARYLNFVPIGAFDDRRNPPPEIYEPEPAPEFNYFRRFGSGGINLFEKFDSTMPSLPYTDVWRPEAVQRYSIEIWCEKSTMNDVLLPICRSHSCNLITGLGELSISAVDKLFDRICTTGKPTRVLYISDYDPAGLSMPVAVSRKAEFMAQNTDIDLMVQSICLTAEQVREYQLPRIPIKDSERRKEAFEARHGEGATELDALEAIHPGELRKIVTNAVMQYRDKTLWRRINDIYCEAQEKAEKDQQRVYDKYQEEINSAKEAWKDVADSINAQLDGWEEQHREFWTQMYDEMHGDFRQDCPEAAIAENDAKALFNSKRDYLEQMKVYRRFQGKEDLQ